MRADLAGPLVGAPITWVDNAGVERNGVRVHLRLEGLQGGVCVQKAPPVLLHIGG